MVIATMTTVPISLFHFLLLIAAICFTICYANSNVRCIHSEREALLKFKNDLIDPSNSLSSWVEGGDCCKWIGVVCHNSTGHVHQLYLAAPLSPYEQSALGGKINPSLLELEHLSFLDLSNNNFSSIQIPKFLGMLPNLMYLNLSFARFQGAIPHNLGNLTKLQYLDLRCNERGDIKATSLQWISGLSSLRYLDLSNADLSKATNWLQVTFKHPSLEKLYMFNTDLEDDPSSISVNSSKSLVVLDLSGNSLSSVPKWIFSLHGLASIYLRSCSLEGPIPDYFGNISFLEVLDLSLNHLNSSIPNSLYGLNYLLFLDLSYNEIEQDISEILQSLSRCCLGSLASLNMESNQLSGHLTDQLGQFKNLAYLSLALNKIFGPIPVSIGELSSLKFFDVSENQLSGQIPLSIGELSSLKFFDVTDNQLNGSLFELVCNSSLTGMSALFIDNNLLIGEIPDCWKYWEYFAYLNLANNNLTGKIPPSLGYTNPCLLNLRNNTMFGELPSTLQNSSRLLMLDLSENHFSGSVPAWIGDKLSKLVVLSLRSNNFDGHIPRKICDLQFLQILDLAHNNISGVIPKCFNNLSAMVATNKTNNKLSSSYFVDSLIYLKALLVLKGREDEYGTTLGLVTSMDLSANSLTGEIPKKIGSLAGLLSLNFSGNLLTGNIPYNIGNMELMESLDLSMNRLNGDIPSSFSNLHFLNHFNVSYNNLTGKIPTSTQLQSFENLSYVGNHLCGPPLTKNCTSKSIPTNATNNGRNSEGSKVNWLYGKGNSFNLYSSLYCRQFEFLGAFEEGNGFYVQDIFFASQLLSMTQLSFQRNGRFNCSQEEFEQALLTSATVYVGNMSFYTVEEQVLYELFSTSSIILGKMQRMLLKYISGTILDPRQISVDFDWGF
ncbi:hypothetical protein GOBAR_DD11229 [Gossypium barbadense]|nr:hypothetical protein GOBAR_DD11229 [Gossypium barbadense]